MSASPTDREAQAEPPLWSVGLAMLLILAAPVILYSLAPTGPLRGGDTVFSEGQQRVPILRHASGESHPRQDFCLLDPGNPLIILEPPADRMDGTLLAQVQGNPAAEWPFCPPHTEVVLTVRQIFQKPEVLRELRDKLAEWFKQRPLPITF